MRRVIVLVVGVLLICGCSKSEGHVNESASVVDVSCEEVVKMVSEGAVLIDVRSAAEYDQGCLDNSVNIDVNEIEDKIGTYVPAKDAKIVVYCKSGNRSASAAKKLIELGYRNVYDLGAMDNCDE